MNEPKDIKPQDFREAIHIKATYRVPRFPIPLTIAMLAERLDGGLGIELETQTRVNANPGIALYVMFTLNRGTLLTGISACH